MGVFKNLIPFDVIEEANPFNLFNKGKTYLSKLQNENWTDHRTHDPGITLLEYLSSSITEMCVRSSANFENYLTYAPYKSAILSQKEAFSVLPVTPNDLRKILIDEFIEIENIWVELVSSEMTSFEGQYHLVVKFKPQYLSQIDKDTFLSKILNYAQVFRNYCERVNSIEEVKQTNVDVQADLEITTDTSVEEVLANVLFSLSRYFSPSIKIESFEELQKAGKTTSQIFEGPKLKRGFIQEDQLHERQFTVLTSAIIRNLMNIEGVVGVKNLSLIVEGKKENSLLKLNDIIPVFQESGDHQIVFYKNGIVCTQFEYKKVYALLDQIKASHEGFSQALTFRKKTKKNIQNKPIPSLFLSPLNIVDNFPLIYGIGAYGLPSTSNHERRKSAKDFKTFVNFFEGQFNEFFKQLYDLPKLFSADGLLMDNDELLISSHFENVQKKKEILDYLIEVHGERFENELITSFSSFLSQKEIDQRLIIFKASFLKYIPQFLSSKCSVRQVDTAIEKWGISSLQLKLMLMMGVGLNKDHSIRLDNTPFFYKQDTFFNNLFTPQGKQKRYLSLQGKTFDFIDIDTPILEEQVNFEAIFLNCISLDFIHQCLNPENLFVVEIPTETTIAFEIIYYSFQQKSFIKVADFATWDKAESTAVQLHHKVIEINNHLETFHIVEHLDLQPNIEEECFGIYIKDVNNELCMMTDASLNFKNREIVLDKLSTYFKESSRYDVERLNNGNFRIVFRIPEFNINFIGIKENESVQKVHKIKEEIEEFLSDKYEVIDVNNKYERHITLNYATNSKLAVERIIERFFNFSISMVFPSISKRFSNSEFQVIVHNLCREEVPAHIQVNTQWLLPTDYKDFEAYICQLQEDDATEVNKIEIRDNLLALLHRNN
ncbi:hypothetical protein [Flammeovirga kamogawensis]|uniref:Lantibiotic dehydratase N-terminal domain-containing protein n=1 Tax=Flammeovirga kamogawensis TaxID=373891 RepID=A0ABX8GYF5_9BACT|nr:hypothetical protein [Flammeovirga kamogawensis]MBB6458868.1 hypothetical protein [Flammeovirga kamogawensis]QWG08449.1 hypothetical protein KM029_05800 [Flammeovirga kamogawensis]TRX66746.1 hypothetical protein EO216_00860 [Flammeovirga kamogawensis]